MDEKSFQSENDDWNLVEKMLLSEGFSYLLKYINGFVLIFNYQTGFYEYISEGFRHSLGFEPQDATGESGADYIYNLIYPEHSRLLVETIMNQILHYLSQHVRPDNGKDFRYNCSLKVKNIYSEFQWYLLDTIIIQTDGNGFPLRTMVTCTNIHAYKKDEIVYYNVLKKDMNGVYKLVLQKHVQATEEIQSLTEREVEILTLISQGKTNPQISKHLSISTATVKAHRRSILSKTNCKGPVALANYAFSRGLF